MQWYYILPIAAAGVLLLLTLFAALTDGFAFGRRFDRGEKIKYFSAEEFNLTVRKVSVKSGKLALNGYLYGDTENSDKIIVFCHGVGPGQAAYTTEIAYFCNNGYPVLALDSRGCDLSEGKSAKGFYSGVKTALCAVDYVKTHFPDKKTVLVGHSWGGYSALVASCKRKVDGVVAISAPSSPARTSAELFAKVLKGFAKILYPFWAVVNFFKYGAAGNANAGKCASKNRVPTLLLHGGKDVSVSVKNSAYSKSAGKHVRKIFYPEKGHNPYNTSEAETLLAKLNEYIAEYSYSNSVGGGERRARAEKNLSEFDFVAATREDEEVMRTVYDFISEI